jgi:hypothetical protein
MATSGFTYLTTDELSERIKYNVRTIRERMLDSVLIEGVHYIRPFGGRKILFLWEKIENDMAQASSAAPFSGGEDLSASNGISIPMTKGGLCFIPEVTNKNSRHAGAVLKGVEVRHG